MFKRKKESNDVKNSKRNILKISVYILRLIFWFIINSLLFFLCHFFFVISGDDCATYTTDGDRADTAKGAGIQVHLQPSSGEGKNRSIHPLIVTSSYISPIKKMANGESRVIITLLEKKHFDIRNCSKGNSLILLLAANYFIEKKISCLCERFFFYYDYYVACDFYLNNIIKQRVQNERKKFLKDKNFLSQ